MIQNNKPHELSAGAYSDTAGYRLAAFCGWVLAVVLLFHNSIRMWLLFSLSYDHYSHLVLIPLVSAFLLYRMRSGVLGDAKTSPATACVVAVAAIGLMIAARMYRTVLSDNDYLVLAIAGVVTLIIAGFVGLFGRTVARKATFPLAFLFLAVPVPMAILDRMIVALQSCSTEVVAVIFSLLRVPYLRHEFVLVLPQVSIEVAKECSGIRSSMALIILALLSGHLFLRTTSRKAVLVALSVPLLIVKNALRIVTLTLLAEYVDPGFLFGNLHREGGGVFFAMTFAIFCLLLHWLRRSELNLGRSVPGYAANVAGSGND